jgi:hypothetical protein
VRRVRLFLIGMVLGAALFLIGGMHDPDIPKDTEPTATLAPWLQKAQCQYVQCSSVPSGVAR